MWLSYIDVDEAEIYKKRLSAEVATLHMSNTNISVNGEVLALPTRLQIKKEKFSNWWEFFS